MLYYFSATGTTHFHTFPSSLQHKLGTAAIQLHNSSTTDCMNIYLFITKRYWSMHCGLWQSRLRHELLSGSVPRFPHHRQWSVSLHKHTNTYWNTIIHHKMATFVPFFGCRFGGNMMASIKIVTKRQARLVRGWVTVLEPVNHPGLLCPSHPSVGRHSEYLQNLGQ